MNTFLRDLALAHQKHEGWFPGSRSYRQNNPGNLRGGNGQFRVFPSYAAGLAALEADLAAKIYGTAGTIQRLIKKSGRPYEAITLQDYIAIYAPTADANNPVAYANAICKDLAKYKITPQTSLPVLAQLIRGEIPSVPDPAPPPISIEKRILLVKRAMLYASPRRLPLLKRLLWRLERLVHQDPL